MCTAALSRDCVADYQRIGAALRFLRRHRRRPVPLAELATAIGLSPLRFRRLFMRWTGIGPKRFARYFTLDDARALLRADASLLEAACRLGLSGPSRLHDLFVTFEAVTPGEYKSGGAGVTIAVGEHDTPFGRCLLGLTPRGVCWLSFVDACGSAGPEADLRTAWPEATLRADRAATAAVAARIFAPPGAGRDRAVRVLVRGTSFQVEVWEALLRIPPGGLATYRDVAVAIGRPAAARAVGNAVGRNPVAFVIPCHRVIRSLGILGNYGGGAERKQAMIAWEAARYAECDRSS